MPFQASARRFPAWPITYDELEPYHAQAERMYHVHGLRGQDPTEPPASGPYPCPPVSNEPRIQQLYDDKLKSVLSNLGMHPEHLIPRNLCMKTGIPIAGCALRVGDHLLQRLV